MAYDYLLYDFIPSLGSNIAMAVLFGIECVLHLVLGIIYKQRWIGVAFSCGLILEVIGYAARSKAHYEPNDKDLYLAQTITLTIAPCFVMGGYYYLLSKFLVIYGTRFLVVKPIYYSYFFIFCDIVSLVLQGGGGGAAATSLESNQSTAMGTHIMVGGLAFQVATMTLFLAGYFLFFYRVYFESDKEYLDTAKEGSGIYKKTWKNFFDTLYKDEIFDPRFAKLRARKTFIYFPFAVLFGTLCIYARCIYRVIELSQGWSGYLITTERFVLLLDGMMLLLASFVLLPPFYPGIVFKGVGEIKVSKSLK